MFISFFTIQLVSFLLITNKFEYNIIFFWGGLCAVLVGSASNVINDIFDVEIDKINRPERILPRQLISISNAWIFYFFLVSFSILIAFKFIPLIPFLIIIMSNILLFIYSWKLKKSPFIGNFIVSFFIGLVFIYSSLLIGEFISGIIPFVFAFFLILSRETVKDIEDIEGDRQLSARTVPIVFGINMAKWMSIGALLVYFSFLVLSYVFAFYGLIFLLTVSIFVIVPGMFLCYKIFKSNSKKEYSQISKWLKFLILPSLTAIFLDKLL